MTAPRRAVRRRAPNLSDDDIAAIVEVLDGWTGTLSWDRLIHAIEKRFARSYTRQALFKHTRIREAFKGKKRALQKQPSDGSRAKSAEMQAALGRIARLEAENQRLATENGQLLEQFARWAYNAHVRGMDEEALNRPLLPVDRKAGPATTGRRRFPKRSR